jgi:uncharacterized FAD-dependent dehydrogenase
MNLHVLGEGAGYAGGIVSAACDGARVAAAIIAAMNSSSSSSGSSSEQKAISA